MDQVRSERADPLVTCHEYAMARVPGETERSNPLLRTESTGFGKRIGLGQIRDSVGASGPMESADTLVAAEDQQGSVAEVQRRRVPIRTEVRGSMANARGVAGSSAAT
jgi:hypothetical protein